MPGSTYDLMDTRPTAIVVHCSDPRFQKAFSDFIRNELQLHEGEYIPLVISGGVAPLAEPLRLPKEFKFMKERIQAFLERYHSITRIVLINHEDCRHYDSLKQILGNLFLRHLPGMSERQKKDLQTVALALTRLAAPGVHIELYFAHIIDGAQPHVTFERV